MRKSHFKPLHRKSVRQIEKSCECGQKPRGTDKGRVVGGKSAIPFEFPWIAAIAYKGARQQFCGGALINDRYILSAAHCFASQDEVPPEQVDILLHAHILDLNLNSEYVEGAGKGEPGSIVDVPGLNEKNYTDAEENTLRLEVQEIVVHPLWSIRRLDFDVCLVKLKTPLNLRKKDQYGTICLPPEGMFYSYADKIAVVAGWGKHHETAGAASRILQKVDLPVLNGRSCRRLISTSPTPRMMCAGYIEGGHDSCVGDSGGPLIYKTAKNKFRQIGVVSFGRGCAQPASPGVYTNIQEVIQWIYRETYDAVWCRP